MLTFQYKSKLFPYTTLFRSNAGTITGYTLSGILIQLFTWRSIFLVNVPIGIFGTFWSRRRLKEISQPTRGEKLDRKSTRLNSSHANISYAVFCLKKNKY